MPTSIPTRRKESEVPATASTEMDAFAEKFNDEFSLVATLSSSTILAKNWRTVEHDSWTVGHLPI
jgi:hypothetical protein